MRVTLMDEISSPSFWERPGIVTHGAIKIIRITSTCTRELTSIAAPTCAWGSPLGPQNHLQATDFIN